jgi:hypothetical protein
MGSSQAVKRSKREAGKNTICCGVKEWVKQYFPLLHVFRALGAKYLNGKGFDCPTQNTQTRRALNVVIYLGHADPTGYKTETKSKK